jgi:hypothetical protein
MNMSHYSALHLDIDQIKGTLLLLLFYSHSHRRDFYNRHNSYPKVSVNGSIAWHLALVFSLNYRLLPCIIRTYSTFEDDFVEGRVYYTHRQHQ